jgi:hypothetical protein
MITNQQSKLKEVLKFNFLFRLKEIKSIKMKEETQQ